MAAEPVRAEIKVTGKTLSCGPDDTIHASRGQRVEWTCAHGPFAIDFGKATPFEKSRFNHNNAAGVVRDDAPNGAYKYAVAVADGKDILIADPQMIIP
jgi:hypothetical protein